MFLYIPTLRTLLRLLAKSCFRFRHRCAACLFCSRRRLCRSRSTPCERPKNNSQYSTAYNQTGTSMNSMFWTCMHMHKCITNLSSFESYSMISFDEIISLKSFVNLWDALCPPHTKWTHSRTFEGITDVWLNLALHSHTHTLTWLKDNCRRDTIHRYILFWYYLSNWFVWQHNFSIGDCNLLDLKEIIN